MNESVDGQILSPCAANPNASFDNGGKPVMRAYEPAADRRVIEQDLDGLDTADRGWSRGPKLQFMQANPTPATASLLDIQLPSSYPAPL